MEAAASESGTVLVDTSLLLQLQKRPKYAKPVETALARYRFRGASSYSYLEIKRAWLRRLGYIHNVTRRPEIRSVADVFDYIAAKLAAHAKQKRALQTCLSMLVQFLDAGAGRISSMSQLVRLRAHCRRCILQTMEAVQETITGAFTGTACVRALERPREQRDGSIDVTIRECKPSKISCEVHKLFDRNREYFASLQQHIGENWDSCSEELRDAKRTIDAAMTNAMVLCDDKNCKRMADCLIAIDGHDMEEYAANNDEEWRTIAHVLGKPLLNPVKDRRFSPAEMKSKSP